MRDEPAALEPHADRAEALLVVHRERLVQRERLHVGVPALGEIPDALLAAAADDGDLPDAARTSSISPICREPHQSWRSAAAAALVRLDLAGEERPALAQLLEDVAAEGRVRPEERATARVERPVVAPHERLEDRQVLDRIDERAPLDELPLLPQEPVELGGVEGAEPAPEDEMLRRRDRRDRVELEEAEPPHRLEDAASRCRRALRAHRDPAAVSTSTASDGGRRPASQHRRECSCDAAAPRVG